jgi:DNA-binding MarR family transcriptional regulator
MKGGAGRTVLRDFIKASNRKELTERLERSVRQSIASAILFNQKVADDVGINLRDLQVLHLLQLRGPSTPRDLARWACVTTGGMTVVLDRLEKGGYAKRAPNPDDRRSSIVHLIPESLRKLEGAYRAKGDQLAGAMAQYGERELRMLIEFFERINDEGKERNS